jgi:hypothetical protein
LSGGWSLVDTVAIGIDITGLVIEVVGTIGCVGVGRDVSVGGCGGWRGGTAGGGRRSWGYIVGVGDIAKVLRRRRQEEEG